MAGYLDIGHVYRSYPGPQGDYLVLEDITFSVEPGEFVSIIGASGCGKSTLLRILCGTLEPTSGIVLYDGNELNGVNLACSMVFQTFALLPWLTVRQNVMLGLEAREIEEVERRRRVNHYIEKVGLSGFEDAYPRELSGGMKQRVGIARALAVEPRVLLLDEPFSNLDPLTAIELREELIDIWSDEKLPVETVVMVTHMLEEAVELADRVIVMKPNPGHIVEDVHVNLPRPRERKDREFEQVVDDIFSRIA